MQNLCVCVCICVCVCVRACVCVCVCVYVFIWMVKYFGSLCYEIDFPGKKNVFSVFCVFNLTANGLQHSFSLKFYLEMITNSKQAQVFITQYIRM